MKNLKRLFSLMLAVCVMATVFAGLTITTSAAAGTPATEVYYCGALLDATNKYLFYKNSDRTTASAATETLADHTLLAVLENGTLTFTAGFDSNLDWNTMINMVQDSTDQNYYGIKANGDLTIDLGSYANFLYIDWHLPTTSEVHAVEVDGDLTITGTTGILKMAAYQPMNSDAASNLTSYGIKASGDVKLLGGTVHIYDRHYDSAGPDDAVVCISAGGNIYVDGSTLRLYSRTNTNFTHFSPEAQIYSGYTSAQTLDKQPDSRGNLTEGSSNNQNNLTLTPPEGAYRISIGKDAVQLGGINKYLYATANDTFTAGSAADGAIAEYDSATETLKFLNNATLEYWNISNRPVAWIVTSNSDLTIDLNGKTVALNSLPAFGEGGAVNVTGALTIKGGGTLNAHTRCVYLGYAGGAVMKSGGKIKVENATVNAHTSADRAHESTPRMSYVMYAPSVEFTTDSTVRLSTGATDSANNVAGRVFYGTPTITIPSQADAFVGNLNAGTSGIPAEDATVKTYSSDLLASSTYFAVSTMDKTVSVDSAAEADGTVTFKLSGDVPVYVIAAGYDANGILDSAVTYSGTADGTEQTLSVGTVETVKLYIWNTTGEMKPLKKVRIY